MEYDFTGYAPQPNCTTRRCWAVFCFPLVAFFAPLPVPILAILLLVFE